MIPKEHEGEPLNDATARVIRCLGGGTATHENADRDLEVLCDSVTVDLRCPVSYDIFNVYINCRWMLKVPVNVPPPPYLQYLTSKRSSGNMTKKAQLKALQV